jgi:hypothetical protein
MNEVELREQIASIILQEHFIYAGEPMWELTRLRKLAEQLIALMKQAGYLPVQEVKLEVLTDEEIINKLGEIQPEGFDWRTITNNELIKFRVISQATIAHNEKEKLYRRVE